MKYLYLMGLFCSLQVLAIENADMAESRARPFVKKEYVRPTREAVARSIKEEILKRNKKVSDQFARNMQTYQESSHAFAVSSDQRVLERVEDSEKTADSKNTIATSSSVGRDLFSSLLAFVVIVSLVVVIVIAERRKRRAVIRGRVDQSQK